MNVRRIHLKPHSRWTLLRIVAFLFGIVWGHSAHALHPNVPLSAYLHTTWTYKDGAPAGITVIAQTPDGWLWLGTPSGLYRFDGVKFSRFVSADGTVLLASNISALFVQRDGQLIVGYIDGGLSAIAKDKVVHLAPRATFSATICVAQDSDGSLWAATMSGLFRFNRGQWTRIGAALGFSGRVASTVVLDHYGRLWASDTEHLYQFDRPSEKFVQAGPTGEAYEIASSPDGHTWRNQAGIWQALPAPGGPGRRPVTTWRPGPSSVGVFDRDGNHWSVHCPVGLCLTRPGQIATRSMFRPETLAKERLDQPWQMSSLSSNNVFEDREGNIWVGTFGGLERFSNSQLVNVAIPPGANFYALVPDENGQPLIASRPKGHLFHPNATEVGPMRENLVIASAVDGGVLIADSKGVQIRKGGRDSAVAFPADASGKPLGNFPIAIAGSTTDFWLGLSGVGLFRCKDGQWTPAKALGIPGGTRSIDLDGEGAAWFGNRDGSVLWFRAGRATVLSPGNEGSVGAVSFIDAKHGVVIAGEEALAVLIDGKFHRLNASDPERLAGISGLIVTANGDRWLNARKGAVHITAKAWADALARPDHVLDTTLHGIRDGYPGAAQQPGLQQAAMQSVDGKLWFVGTSGVAWLDPARLPRNPVPPAMSIGRLPQAGARGGADGGYTLPPGTTELRIDYTALSLTKPEQVRFRYRLDGVDSEWQHAGARRTAFYTNLGPGDYRFRVKATNEDGVDSVQAADMRVTILPSVIETRWFKALCVGLLAATLLLLHRWRTHRIARRQWEQFQVRLSERERIARTLHDNLMQNFQGLLLFFRLHSDKLAAGDAARISMERLLGQAADVMTEARQEITELRQHGQHPEVDISHALTKFGIELQAQFGPRFTLSATGRMEGLTAHARNEMLAIGREAIFNAYQHAQPKHVEVALNGGMGSFVLVVRDDGCGMDGAVDGHGARAGHWGLPGMLERALTMGGNIVFRRRSEGGTEVVLNVPAGRAYDARQRQRWRSVLWGRW